ncbi:MAG TPA: cytochrome c3 family protein [Pontiella sp.]
MKTTSRPSIQATLKPLLIALLTVLLNACATERQDKWLRFFFDGVPPRKTAESDLLYSPSITNSIIKKQPRKTLRPKTIIHSPFAEKDCAACHTSKYSQNLNGTQLDVCYSCHDNLTEGMKFTHDPVDQGDCTECHNPHLSRNKHLLNKPGAGTCYECHDNLTEGMKFTHDPAAEGSCMECHDPHASENKYLLKQSGSGLCYECHDEADILENPVHSTNKEADCIHCHNPHAGDEHLLKPNWNK